MKKCLYCDNEFEAKKDTAKFCSVSHRVMWNRKNKPYKIEVSKFEKEDLLSAILSIKEDNKIIKQKIDNILDDRSNPLINAARGRDENGINNDELRGKSAQKLTTIIHKNEKIEPYLKSIKNAESVAQIENIVLEAKKSSLQFFDKKAIEDFAKQIISNLS